MSTDMGTPITPLPEPKKRNTTLIIITVVLVLIFLCCICAGVGLWILWENGDEWFGPLINSLSPLF